MTTLITGGGGFLGSGIARALLDRGESVRILARGDYPDLRALGIETIRGDIADADTVDAAVKGCVTVYHTAAKAGVGGRYASYYAPNVVGTENVIAACGKNGVPKLIFTSSPSVAFDGSDQEGLDESAPYPHRFLAAYPETKAIAERAVLAANGPTLSTVALRPHLIWGPGDSQLVPRLIERAQRNRLRILGSGNQRVDATYIDNAVHAHLLAGDRLEPGAPCAGKAYYITNDEPIAIAELINAILRAGGVPPVSKHISPGLAYVAGAVLEVVYRLFGRDDEPPMTRFVARQLSTAHWYDISAAKRDLDYAPIVNTEKGLHLLAESLAKF
ncbi:MAG: NAD-dependent epimerase/dehydratase family protein [Candidatus Hydrogenedentes bacterium]|nr:NAD-dependent epimerase/dehydratase family protein [Candidatus Hydrogenedentota bacterium]